MRQALMAAQAWQGQQNLLGVGQVAIIAREGEVRGVSTATDQVVEMHKVQIAQEL